MARLKFRRETPVRGWFFIEPKTRLRIVGESLDNLAKLVTEHRTYKGLPRATVAEASIDIERQICTRLGSRECISEGIADEWKPVKDSPILTVQNAISFSRSMIEWIASGKELVPMEEAQRRADICKGCALNNPVIGCKCSAFYKLVDKSVPFERRDPGLGVCGICSCSLICKTNLPLSVIKTSNAGRELEYPPHCWQNEVASTPASS
jgi:hypothetical protein